MGILARLRLAKIRTMARPNSPDMPPKRTKKVRLGISAVYMMYEVVIKVKVYYYYYYYYYCCCCYYYFYYYYYYYFVVVVVVCLFVFVLF